MNRLRQMRNRWLVRLFARVLNRRFGCIALLFEMNPSTGEPVRPLRLIGFCSDISRGSRSKFHNYHELSPVGHHVACDEEWQAMAFIWTHRFSFTGTYQFSKYEDWRP